MIKASELISVLHAQEEKRISALGILTFWQCPTFVTTCYADSRLGKSNVGCTNRKRQILPLYHIGVLTIFIQFYPVLVSLFSILEVYETFFGYYVTLFSFCQPPYVNLALNFYPQDCGTVKSFLASLCTSPQC